MTDELTDKQTKAVGIAAAQASLKRYARRATVGYLILLIGVGFSIYGVEGALKDSKSRGAAVRDVVCLILQQADQFSYKGYHEGKISPTELVISLRSTAHFREEIGKGYDGSAPHCSAGITPQTKIGR